MKHPRPVALYVLVLLHLLLGLGGLYGGLSLTLDPTGGALQMPLWQLDDTPFRTFFIPGLILLLFNGLMPLLVAWGLLFRPRWRWPQLLNIYPDRHWAWTFSLYIGITLAIWIDVQMLLLGPPFSLLQPVYSLWATATIVMTMWPGVLGRFREVGDAD